MTLYVLPASNLNPWDYIFQNLVDEIPAGSFYWQGLEMMPRSTKKQEILIFTDREVETRVYNGGQLVTTFTPLSYVTRLKVYLFNPPSSNDLIVYNGIDEPARLQVLTSHQAAHFQIWARELYEFSGYTAEKYWSSMQSPWATFFVEYQYPWLNLLPDIRELRILSVKMIGNTLFGEFGTNGGVRDFISGFTVSTPAILPARNRPTWEFDLWQPVRSGDDKSGFKAHFWAANLCLSRWLAFVKLLSNLSCYELGTVTEDVVKFRLAGTDSWQQHIFNPTGKDCSVSGLLDYLGCMDNVAVACSVYFKSWPTICAWAHPFDSQVESPGMGSDWFFDSGYYFDEGKTLDSIYDIDLLTDFWVGTGTSNGFDSESCFDTYNTPVTTPANTSCCKEGPDTGIYCTTVVESSTSSTNSPNHPIFGGSDLGLLSNPTFSKPYVTP